MRRTLVVLSLLALVSGTIAGEFVHPKWKYRLDVPRGWSQKLVAGKLLLAGPGGFQGQVETYLRPDEVSEADAERVYRSDGRKLKKAYGAVKVVQPLVLSEDVLMGDRATFRYAFRYKAGRGRLNEARGFVASGDSEGGKTKIWIRVMAYGTGSAWKQNTRSLVSLLASVEWPTADVEPVQVADTGAPEPVILASETGEDPYDDGGYESDDSGEYKSKNDGFNRGSKKGGLGFMQFMKRSTDHETNKRLLKAWTPDGTAERSEEDQDQAAQRMGFNER